MSDKKYTLTVYLAAPGTPMADKDTGEITYSLPGHAYYAVSDGATKQGFGFAPTGKTVFARMNGPGEPQPDEYKIYRNPHYERTMEITRAQYQALLDFGKKPQEVAGFNEHHYNFATNSCVDFTFAALKHAGIYKGRQTSFHDEFGNEYSWLDTRHEGLMKVLPNKAELEKIPNPVPGSPLNRSIERPLPPRDLLRRLLSENRHQSDMEQPQYAQARSLSINDVPAPAQKLYAQTEERMRAFYQEFDVPFQEHELKNAAAALAVVAYEKRLPEVQDFELHNGKMVAFYESRGGAYKEALLDADFANNMPQQESFARMIEAEPKLELAAQQRAMEIAAYEQSQSMGRSI